MRAAISFVASDQPREHLYLRKTDRGLFVPGITQEKCYSCWSVYLMFEKEQELEFHKEYEVSLEFVSPLALDYFKSGDELLIKDGLVLIAKGLIL
jgi:hypothetical protein